MTETNINIVMPLLKGTYQHCQGTMLVNLNKISSKLSLTHSEYRLMATLITFWNKLEHKAYPTISQLAEICGMGKTSIIKILKKLANLKLIIIDKLDNKRNCYLMTNLLIENQKGSPTKPQISTPCKTTHDIEQKEEETKRKNIIKKETIPNTNDVLFQIFRLDEKLTTLEKGLDKNLNTFSKSCIISDKGKMEKRKWYGTNLQECFNYRC